MNRRVREPHITHTPMHWCKDMQPLPVTGSPPPHPIDTDNCKEGCGCEYRSETRAFASTPGVDIGVVAAKACDDGSGDAAAIQVFWLRGISGDDLTADI